MTRRAFASQRADGRSAADVLLQYVKPGSPGQTFTYAELASALSAGANRSYDRGDVQRVVQVGYRRLLREQQRTLVCVRDVGYRIAPAHEHRTVALEKKRRSDVQLHKGLQVLRHVAWEDLDPTQRHIHEGTLMVVSALWENQRALERRQADVERAIAGLAARVDAIADK
jgi:hypothetical protein